MDDLSFGSLPYYEQEYDNPQTKASVLKLIEEEMQKFPKSDSYLSHLPPVNLSLFETDLVKAEMERISQQIPLDPISTKRYQVPQPAQGIITDPAAWMECVNNAMAQVNQQKMRIKNLQRSFAEGSSEWLESNELVSKLVNCLQKELESLRNEIKEIHLLRKNEHIQAGEYIKNLQQQWMELIRSNYELSCTIEEMEQSNC